MWGCETSKGHIQTFHSVLQFDILMTLKRLSSSPTSVLSSVAILDNKIDDNFVGKIDSAQSLAILSHWLYNHIIELPVLLLAI